MQRVTYQPPWIARRAERLRARRGKGRVVRWIAYAGSPAADQSDRSETAPSEAGRARDADGAEPPGNIVHLRPRPGSSPQSPG
ncbi:hypothetical protein [Methylobacterium oxalidis]|uniref:hypothetical protein n=1 Tax=Methylobacterium oxalidis TaxID=944322 RepID=UPI003314F063